MSASARVLRPFAQPQASVPIAPTSADAAAVTRSTATLIRQPAGGRAGSDRYVRVVPKGTYLHGDGVAEEFSCAAGPAGWRYASVLRSGDAVVGRVDVTLDGGGRQVRVEIAGGGWRLRGGVAGAETVWIRLPDAPAGFARLPGERSVAALGLTGRSPAFAVAVARRLRLSAGGSARCRLVAVTEPALGTLVSDQQWRLVGVTEHATETVPLPVARYDVTDLGTSETRTLHLAGDVLVGAPDVELTDLSGPPSL
jgi:hypothetical protein